MNHSYKLMLFSPQHSDFEVLDSTLTSDRRKIATMVTENLEESLKTGRATHILLIGPRGSGKTHLLTYITELLQKDQTIVPKFQIYRFSEEERGIVSLMDVLYAALKTAEGFSEKEIISQIPTGDLDAALRAMEEIFLKHSAGLPSILIMENIEIVFRGLKKKGQSDLRGFLQTHTNISLLASSIELFSGSQGKDHPFYGFFRIENLKRLDEDEAREFLIMLARLNNEKALVDELQKDRAMRRVRAIFALTGGNHRLLAMLSCFLNYEGLEELVQPFIQLTDRELTPYYQERLSRLSAQQNKILGVIAQQGGRAVNVSEIAEKSFLDSRTVSRQLHDMFHDSFVRRTKVGRESYYELNEPLLRIVMDIKESRGAPLPLIIGLLRSWYSADELKKLAAIAPATARKYYQSALEDKTMPFEERLIAGGQARIFSQEVADQIGLTPTVKEDIKLIEKGIKYTEEEQYDKAIKVLTQVLKRSPENLFALLFRSVSFKESGKNEQALKDISSAASQLDQTTDTYLKRVLVHLLAQKEIILLELKRLEEALNIADKVVELVGTNEEPELSLLLANVLLNKGIAFEGLDKTEEEIAAYDEIVIRFGEHEEEEMLKTVAQALIRKGITLRQLNRPEDGLTVFTEVVERLNGRQEPQLSVEVANAFGNIGITYSRLDQPEEAITAFNKIVDLFSERQETELLVQVSEALLRIGATHGMSERYKEALDVFKDLIRRFGESKELEIQRMVAEALYNIGFTLGFMDRPLDALATYDEIVNRFRTSKEKALSEQVIRALNNKGFVLMELGQIQKAMTEFDSVIKMSGDNVTARYGRINAFIKSGRAAEALLDLEEVLHSLSLSQEKLAVLAYLLLTEYTSEGVHFQAIISGFLKQDASIPIVNGLVSWFKEMLPLSKTGAEALAVTENTVEELLGDEPLADHLILMLNAAIADAKGDKKALLALPLELRKLIQSAKGEEVDA